MRQNKKRNARSSRKKHYPRTSEFFVRGNSSLTRLQAKILLNSLWGNLGKLHATPSSGFYHPYAPLQIIRASNNSGILQMTMTYDEVSTAVAAVILDLDQTIAQAGDREIFYSTQPRNYAAAEAAVHFDELKTNVYASIHKEFPLDILKNNRYHYHVILTARSGTKICRENTLKWLREKKIEHNGLYMRTPGDHRPDYVIKRELLEKIRIEFPIIAAAYDDQPLVVNMFLEAGVQRVFQVEGDNIVEKFRVPEPDTLELMDEF